MKKESKRKVGKCQLSDKEEYIEKHHIFRKSMRRGIALKPIKVEWIKRNNTQGSAIIQMNATVDVCDEKHKLIHPENLNFHLNKLVVQSLKEKGNVNWNNNTTRVHQVRIQILKPEQLKIGDYILWTRYKCKIINLPRKDNNYCEVLQDENDENSKIQVVKYSSFYKIIEG